MVSLSPTHSGGSHAPHAHGLPPHGPRLWERTPRGTRRIGDILFETRGALGLVTLNRPAALNALTHGMILELDAQLEAWAEDPAIAIVAIRGAGEKAFCAGGDIRALHDAGSPGGARGAANFPFYADEYRLNTRIKRYPKPYVALIDGIVMGGGVGVSIHGTLRIATERTVFAMPETGIGLFPDVGGTHFLPRLAGETGMWLGLTGSRLKGAAVVAAGLADALVPVAGLDALIEEMAAGREPELEDGPAPLPDQDRIDRSFAAPSVTAILTALEREGAWGAATAETILGKSPTCTEIAFRQIRMGRTLAFEDAMCLEYRLARFCMTHGDFYEGVRALLIDKSRPPAWSPARLDEVDQAALDAAFAPGSDELRL